jgi:hypothetical protein
MNLNTKKYNMSENQAHGFKYEKLVCNDKKFTDMKQYEKKYGKQKGSNYTSVYDAIDESRPGKKYKGRPVQIKCIGMNSAIEMGDIFRNSKKDEDFTLVVGFWLGKKTNIVQEIVLDINHKKWNKLFKWDKYDELKDWIKNKVSNARSYDKQWEKERLSYKQLWGESRLITPTFKRDHGTQRRIQCQIGYNNFMNEFVTKKICK